MLSVWKYVVLTGKSWWRGEGSDGGAVGEDAKGGQPHPNYTSALCLSCSTNALQIVQLWIMEMLTKFLSMKFKPCFEPTLSHQVAALSALREENEELREQNTSLSLVITKMAEKAGKTTRVWMFCLFNFEGHQRIFMLPPCHADHGDLHAGQEGLQEHRGLNLRIFTYLPFLIRYYYRNLTNPNLYMKVNCLIVIYIYSCLLWSVPSK